MGLKIHSDRLPPLFCAVIGAAIALLIASLLWWLQGNASNHYWGKTYGENLAEMAARSAIDSTLNHDLVSLQVVLQDIEQSPHVVFATIHDVENNLLVQAGASVSAHQLPQLSSFTASIGFQQNVAGYVTVHLSLPTAADTVFRVLLITVAILLLIGAMSLFEARRAVFEPIPDEVVKDTAPPLEVGDSGEEDPAEDTFVVRATAQVILTLDHYPRLMKTLSADLADQIKEQLCYVTNEAMEMYMGQWARAPETTIDDGVLVVLFPSAQSDDDALRQAAFFSEVVKKAFSPSCIKTSLNATIGLQDELNMLESKPVSPMAIYLASEETRLVLARRMTLQQLDDYWWQIESFDGAYQKQLDEQVAELLSLI